MAARCGSSTVAAGAGLCASYVGMSVVETSRARRRRQAAQPLGAKRDGSLARPCTCPPWCLAAREDSTETGRYARGPSGAGTGPHFETFPARCGLGRCALLSLHTPLSCRVSPNNFITLHSVRLHRVLYNVGAEVLHPETRRSLDPNGLYHTGTCSMSQDRHLHSHASCQQVLCRLCAMRKAAGWR